MDPINNPTPNPIPTPNPAPTPAGNPAVTNFDATNNPNLIQEPEQSVNPAAAATPGMGAPASPFASELNPTTNLPGTEGLAATDPIMKPEPLPEPDPVEEELKAPMKAAAPVPGSIGSAVSGPTNGERAAPTMNPFAPKKPATEPTTPEDTALEDTNATPAPEKKKNDRKTLLILIGIAAVIIVILIIILIMQLTSGNSSKPNNITPVEDWSDVDVEDAPESMSCRKDMTAEELALYAPGAVRGTISVDATFDEDTNLVSLNFARSTVTEEAVTEDTVNSDTTTDSVELLAGEITAENAAEYYIDLDKNGEPMLGYSEMKINYEVLDFICEAE